MLAGEPLDGADDEALQGPMFLPRITEMDGRGGIVVEVAGGVESFKHQIICVLLRCLRGAKYLWQGDEGGLRPITLCVIYIHDPKLCGA